MSGPSQRLEPRRSAQLRSLERDRAAPASLPTLLQIQLLAMLDEIARVLRPGGVCISNYGLIDDLETVEQRLDAVRRAARSRRFNGSVQHACIQSQVTALHDAAGLDVVEACVDEDGARVIIVGRT